MQPGYTLVDDFRDAFQARMVCEMLQANGVAARIETVKGMAGSGARLAARWYVTAPTESMPEVQRILADLAAAGEEHDDAPPAPAARPRRSWWARLFGGPPEY